MSCNTPWPVDRRAALILGAALCVRWPVALANNAPLEPHPQLPQSRPQGSATLRFLGLSIYRAQLWTRSDFNASAWDTHPLVLELQYQRSLRGALIAERAVQEMRRAGSFSAEQEIRWLEAMQRLFPDVRDGDRLTGVYQPGQGAAFWFNGSTLGSINDAAFARLFFAIWMAPTTSEPAMRRALLGTTEGGAS